METAKIEYLENGTPYAPRYRDVYRTRSGAGQAAQVFVEGNQIGERLREHGRLAILETGFGLGLNFVATLRAAVSLARGVELRYTAIELHPAALADVARAHGPDDDVSATLIAAYPELLLSGCATLRLAQVRVELKVVTGDGADALKSLPTPDPAAAAGTDDAPFDALYLDGFSPDRNVGLWNEDVYRELARLSQRGTTLSTYTVARAVRLGLTAAGFAIEKADGFGDKRYRLAGNFEPLSGT